MNTLLLIAVALLFLSLARSLLQAAPAPPAAVQQISRATGWTQDSNQVRPGVFSHVDFSKKDCKETLTSQHGEEKFLYSSFWSSPSPMTNGFYLELGAFDGVEMSNTHWLDKCLGGLTKGVLLGWSSGLFPGLKVSLRCVCVCRVERAVDRGASCFF